MTTPIKAYKIPCRILLDREVDIDFHIHIDPDPGLPPATITRIVIEYDSESDIELVGRMGKHDDSP